MGSLLIAKTSEEQPCGIMETLSVILSPKVSKTGVKPHMAVLLSHQLMESADKRSHLDNEVLYDRFFQTLNLAPTTYDDFHHLACAAMCRIILFAGQLTCYMRQITATLLPFPCLRFSMARFAPLAPRGSQQHWQNNGLVPGTCFVQLLHVMATTS